MKGGSWEGSGHGVGFVYAPGRIPAQEFGGLFHIVDWGPTMLALVDGASPPLLAHLGQNIDGVDQSVALKQMTGSARQEACIAWSTSQNQTSVVNIKHGAKWKLVAGSVQNGAFFREPVSHWSVNLPMTNADGETEP